MLHSGAAEVKTGVAEFGSVGIGDEVGLSEFGAVVVGNGDNVFRQILAPKSDTMTKSGSVSPLKSANCKPSA